MKPRRIELEISDSDDDFAKLGQKRVSETIGQEVLKR